MRFLKPLVLGLSIWAMASPAHAAMVTAQNPKSLVSALQNAGYQALLGADKMGDPMITSAVNGSKFQILFYNCTKNVDCRTVEFYSAYHLDKPISLEQMNAYNQANRFIRAYLDKDNDPILAMGVDLDDGGVSDALFIDNIEFWSSFVASFERHIGYRS